MLSAAVSGLVYNAMRNREMDAIKDRANLVADLLNKAVDYAGFTDYANDDSGASRITIISADGTVLLDNKANAATLENHGDRVEFQQARQTGRGEAARFSATLGAETYYYAIRLSDGNVLRISNTMSNMAGVSTSVMPAIAVVTALVMLLANILARRLTKNIINPLANIDFDGDNTNIYDELLPYVKKIDQQKTEIAKQIGMLQNRADMIEIITGNMNEGLILIDKNGMLLAINKSASDIFREKDMPAGKSIFHLGRDLEFQKNVKDCLAGVNAEMALSRYGKIYSVYFSPFRDREVTGGVILFHDISEKHEAEKQRKEFSANVSHELKTPLTTIFATAEIINSGMAGEEDVRAFAGKITVQAKRLINIIEDIIKLSEFDEGTIIAEYSEFDLYELSFSVAEALQQKADEKQVTVEITGARFDVKANKQMIDELLFNLIDNAIKYNKDSGLVNINLSKEDSGFRISVADTGIGIPEEHQSRVFERFYRVDKSRSKKTGGTGLGLSIVKHISEHHGGRVTLTSDTVKGTTIGCFIQE